MKNYKKSLGSTPTALGRHDAQTSWLSGEFRDRALEHDYRLWRYDATLPQYRIAGWLLVLSALPYLWTTHQLFGWSTEFIQLASYRGLLFCVYLWALLAAYWRKPYPVLDRSALAAGMLVLMTNVATMYMAEDAGIAYVVVTHLSPNFKSLMDELLARHTKMPVRLVEDGVIIRPNEVYVIPPNSEMIVVAGRLLLSDREPGPQLDLPIDTFFNSLARDCRDRSVAVVLSGTGGDGSHALENVREAGGLVFVQDPTTAKFDGMPKAAIQTGQTDAVLTPSEIGERLQKLDNHLPRLKSGTDNPEADADSDAIRRIFEALFGSSSIDFEAYKSTTVLRRIDRRAAATKSGSLVQYAELLENDQGEAESLSRDMLIGVTHFSRDEEAFRKLSIEVFPKLLQKIRGDRPLRIWSVGCATGEEAYSVAMMLRREIDLMGIDQDVQIFATDLQREFIDHAGRGVFPRESFPRNWKDVWERYTFDAEAGQLQISPEVRRMVVFAHHNALSDPPFTRLDLVTCRNMLIYLQPEAQDRVLSLITFGLRRGGFLFLGPSETLGDTDHNYATIEKRWRIYRKEHDSGAFHVPDRQVVRDRPSPMVRQVVRDRTPRNQQQQQSQILPAYSAMLEKFAPPGLLIDGQRQLVHTFGSARNYVRPPEGLASLDVMQMVPEGLKLPLATAIDRVNREGREVRYEGAPAGDGVVNITVFPTEQNVEGRRGHKVILLERQEENATSGDQIEILDTNSIARARIEDLEGELRYTRENFQAAIEEVETSNEELQSTNEELMAANEELQSTNEELHSVNEELYSVNAEYQRKNDELIQLNRDMEALMSATDVGVIFVDEDMAVRRFTEPAKRVFNLITEDKGRKLGHMTHRLIDADVVGIARRSIEQFVSTENEFEADDGEWWLLRCMPMRTPGSSAIGAIITIIDINELRNAKQQVELEAWCNSLITDIGNALVVSWDSEFRIVEQTPGWALYTGQKFSAYRDSGWLDAAHEDDRSRVRLVGDQTLEGGRGAAHQVLFRLFNEESGEYRHCQCHFLNEAGEDGGPAAGPA